MQRNIRDIFDAEELSLDEIKMPDFMLDVIPEQQHEESDADSVFYGVRREDREMIADFENDYDRLYTMVTSRIQ